MRAGAGQGAVICLGRHTIPYRALRAALVLWSMVPGRHDRRMPYQERVTSLPGVVLWQDVVGTTSECRRILPDGCMDLVWDGHRLFVAGPDTTARQHQSPAGASYAALRFSGGTGPALVGVPADELRDRTPGLDQLWPARDARVLAEQVAADPAAVLRAWAERLASREVDALGPRVLEMARTGTPVAVMADRVSLSVRQLHRRCVPLFGYGPRRLARVLRLGRALDQARSGGSLALMAAGCGYADQAHLSREVRALTGATPTALVAELGLA